MPRQTNFSIADIMQRACMTLCVSPKCRAAPYTITFRPRRACPSGHAEAKSFGYCPEGARDTEEKQMFRVDVDSLKEYFEFDPERKIELQKLDKHIRSSAPELKRYFHRGTPAGEPGMRFKMIGYGKLHYQAARSETFVEWPAVGVALQRNYISVYLSVLKDGAPLLASYSGTLGELRSGDNNFSFKTYKDLDVHRLASLFAEAEQIVNSDLRRCSLAHGGMKPLKAR
jgi:hypothetical protein